MGIILLFFLNFPTSQWLRLHFENPSGVLPKPTSTRTIWYTVPGYEVWLYAIIWAVLLIVCFQMQNLLTAPSSQNSHTYRTWCCTQKAFGNYLCFKFFYIWHHCLHIRLSHSKPPTTTTASVAQIQCWLPHSKPHLLQESNLVLNMSSKFWHFGVWILHQYYHETQL